MTTAPSRVGLIVPSSNTTMETELPELFRRQSAATGTAYTFHSSRARMRTVNEEELRLMVGKAADCAAEAGAHVESEDVIAKAAAANGHPAAVVSSAGALVRTIAALGVSKVAIVTPYMRPLTDLVSRYIEGQGIEVLDAVALEVPDNLDVGRLDAAELPGIARGLRREGAEAVVLSACVQMPSLPAVQAVEDEIGLPVLTAATATTFEVLSALGHSPRISGAGRLLSGAVAPV
jgi:maleate isomerase